MRSLDFDKVLPYMLWKSQGGSENYDENVVDSLEFEVFYFNFFFLC